MTKPYINSWQPHEVPYVKAMALAGISCDECTARLLAVNTKLGAPGRTPDTVQRMGAGAFDAEVRRQRKADAAARYRAIERHVSKTNDTFEKTASVFGCSVSTVTAAIRYVRETSDIKGSKWQGWETFYCLELRKQGLEYREIYLRLAPISRKLNKQIRTREAIAEKVQKTKRLKIYDQI